MIFYWFHYANEAGSFGQSWAGKRENYNSWSGVSWDGRMSAGGMCYPQLESMNCTDSLLPVSYPG